jgi:hypothetical protein
VAGAGDRLALDRCRKRPTVGRVRPAQAQRGAGRIVFIEQSHVNQEPRSRHVELSSQSSRLACAEITMAAIAAAWSGWSALMCCDGSNELLHQNSGEPHVG